MISLDVSVIIVNYNTKELLSNCIDSIKYNTKGLSYEIIVVDNNSNDGSREMIRTQFQDVILIDLKENIGFGRANNIGFKNSKGKYYMLLNSDTILKNNAIMEFYTYYERMDENNIGALGSWLYDEKGNIIISSSEFPSMKNIIIQNIKSVFSNTQSVVNNINVQLNNTEVDYITGADLFVKKNIIDNIGGFDQRFFMYYEEAELQFRMSKKLLKRLVINGPKIVHLEGKSFKVQNNKRIEKNKSMFQYFRITSNKGSVIIFKIVYLAFRIIAMLKMRYSFKENMEYLKKYLKS